MVGSREKGAGIGTPVLRDLWEGETPRGLLGRGSASKAKDGVPLGSFRVSDYFFALIKLWREIPVLLH